MLNQYLSSYEFTGNELEKLKLKKLSCEKCPRFKQFNLPLEDFLVLDCENFDYNSLMRFKKTKIRLKEETLSLELKKELEKNECEISYLS